MRAALVILVAASLLACAKDAEPPPAATPEEPAMQEMAHLEQPLSGPAGGKADGKDRGKQVAQFAPVLADPEPAAAPEPEPPPPPPAPLKRPASPRPVDALALNAKERNLEAPEPKASKRRFELSKSEAKPGAEGEPDGGEFRFQARDMEDEKRAAPAEPEDREGLKWAEVSEDDFADARRAPPRSELSRSETVALPAQDAANRRDLLVGLDGNTRGPLGGDAGDLDRGLLTDQVHLDLGGARWAALGLRPGDKLLTIDGEPPHRGEALRGRGAPPVLEVERDGRRVVLYPDGSAGTDDAADDAWAADPKPARFLPRMGYFENTYLGRSPEYLRQLRRLDAAFDGPTPYGPATLPPQALDAPEGAGLALSATLDRPSLEQPHRVFLQVALKGSERFGWRRPPLDLVLVVDAALAAAEPETLTKAVTGLMRRLDPRDRLGVVVAQPDGPQVLSDVAELREARRALTRTLVDGVSLRATDRAAPLAAALDRAGRLLQDAAQGQARVPGSQTVLLLTRGGDGARVQAAARVAHQLTLQGAVTSVIDLADTGDLWWQVAQAGHGHDHRGRALGEALDAELASLAKVIARLLRINVRLAPDVHAVRILGSRMLSEVEKQQVKAREEATDRQISKTLGVKADRGDDDDGLQVVMPYFYGGDAHVVLIELWVERPGAVAEITLKYKDMVQLSNATARANAALAALPAPLTAAHRAVRANVRGFEFAQHLAAAAAEARRGLLDDARRTLAQARPVTAQDRLVLARFQHAFDRHAQDRLADALHLASRRRIAAEAAP